MIEEKIKKMPIFAARFSGLRGDRTQAEFAEFLGISRPTVGFYENGERIPDALVLKQIAGRCGVTTDYLVGLSDNKVKENSDIGSEFGLSDSAINQLKKKKSNKFYTISLSYLIEQHECLQWLVTYLLSFIPHKVKETNYKYVPLKNRTFKYFKDIAFSAFINRLPKYQNEAQLYFESNKEKLEAILEEYVLSNANISECRSAIYVNEDCYDPDELDEISEEDYKYYLEVSEFDIDEHIKEAEEYERTRKQAIEKILELYEEKKEGALNADDPETR